MASDKPATPFEWLAGGLFFGKGKEGSDDIDSCKDADVLLQGMAEDLQKIIEAPVEGAADEPTADLAADNSDSEPSSTIASRLSRLRFLLYDERRVTSQDDSRKRPEVASATLQGFTGEFNELLPQLLQNLHLLPFETRKHATAIFSYMLVSGLEGDDAVLYQPIMVDFVAYVEARFEIFMAIIVQGHDVSTHGTSDVVLHFGSMFRSCLRHVPLFRELVGTSDRAKTFVFPFLDQYVHVPNFDASSDAMESLRTIFTASNTTAEDAASDRNHVIAEFLTRDYIEVFDDRFNPKLLSDSANYMTRRVALQILSSVLLTRSNYSVMIKYVASRYNLVLVMKLLRDQSPHITWDAFHVFKVFVANPNKPQEVTKILKDNKVKLGRYLTTLHQDKEASDVQFRDEKALIIATINEL